MQRATFDRVDLRGIGVHRAIRFRELRRIFAGALAEHDQIRQRIAAQAIGAVQTRRGFAGREQPRQRRHL